MCPHLAWSSLIKKKSVQYGYQLMEICNMQDSRDIHCGTLRCCNQNSLLTRAGRSLTWQQAGMSRSKPSTTERLAGTTLKPWRDGVDSKEYELNDGVRQDWCCRNYMHSMFTFAVSKCLRWCWVAEPQNETDRNSISSDSPRRPSPNCVMMILVCLTVLGTAIIQTGWR